MIALASSRILELSWVFSGGRVADKRLVTRRPILAPEPKETTAFLPGFPVDFRFNAPLPKESGTLKPQAGSTAFGHRPDQGSLSKKR
jgi:hypothetical protein